MRPKRLSPPVRRTTRRWRTPPAITHGAEPFEGLTVLDEVKGPLGFLLWLLGRNDLLFLSRIDARRVALPDQGDLIQDLIAALRDYKPGDTVTLTVDRNGDNQNIDVKLGDRGQ